MKWLSVLVALTAVAAAEPKRKHKPDKYEAAAGEAFAKAIELDDRGEVNKAAREYRKALKLAAHPNVAYNLAEVEARAGDAHAAIKAYELYLTLAPAAPDRKQVMASIADLEHGPTTIELGADAADLQRAYVLLDGAIVKRPNVKPAPIATTVGFHTVDIVTPTSSSTTQSDIGRSQKLRVELPARVDGSVVVSVADHIVLAAHGRETGSRNNRLELDKGRYRAAIADRTFECPPITIDVPGGNDVAYVYVAPAELRKLPMSGSEPNHCRKLDVKQLKLVFE